MVGTTLGHYRIVQLLGRGGMGEVYLADDTKLQRQVALKVLARELADDPDRRERFEREARAVAALNHPNIVTIYSVEESGRQLFLTLELIDGQPLGAHIPESGLPLDRLLTYAIPLADAVGAAHQRGITHRDLKPANVMVATDGRVKVLDFGLAKQAEPPRAAASAAPTMELTGEGRILGTAAYMSPEQAEGKPVDARSDVFSLGVMLYEMATGERPFKGDTQVAVISAIIKDTPSSVTDLKRDLPRELARIVHRCLKKDPEDRYQTAKDVRNDLRGLKEDLVTGELRAPSHAAGSAAAATPAEAGRRRAMPLVAGAIALAAIGALAVFLYSRQQRPAATPPAPAASFQTVALTRLTNVGTARRAALSADGRYVAYVTTQDGRSGLSLRQVQTGSTVPILPPAPVRFAGLSFSPDSNYVHYAVYPEGKQIATLYQVPVLGGAARRLAEDVDSEISFAPDGSRFAFLRGASDPQGRRVTSVMVAEAGGGNVRELASRTFPSMFLLTSAAWSPDGRSIVTAGVEVTATTGSEGASVGIFRIDAGTGQVSGVGKSRWRSVTHLSWLPDGTALLVNAQDLAADQANQIWLLPVPDGDPRRITNDLHTYAGLSLSGDGKAFVTVLNDRRARVWIAPDGNESKAQPITTGAGADDGTQGISWLPDGRLLYSSSSTGNSDIWAMNADGSNRSPLTNNPANETWPRASADGKTIIFVTERGASRELWRMDGDGGGQRRLGPHSINPRPSISADGKWAYYHVAAADNYKIPTTGGDPVPLFDDEAQRKKLPVNTHEAVPSPDGRLIAAHYSDASTSGERIVVFEATGNVTARLLPNVQIPILWPADGQSLLYPDTRSGIVNVWRQPLAGGPPVQLTHFTSERIFGMALAPAGRGWAIVRGDDVSDVVLVTQR